MEIENKKINKMSVKDFRAQGFLRELNRQFLHPLGLALEVEQQGDGTEKFGQVWDYRDDPEGMIFQDLTGDEKLHQGEEIERLRSIKASVRQERFGFVVQPLGHKFEQEE